MDGRITVLAGTTFTEFVDRHRPELVRVVALAGGSVEAAAVAVDAALLSAERRWDRIDGDPSAWVIRRATSNLRLPEDTPVARGLEALPVGERLDAILVNYLEWTPRHRAAAGAVATAHAEQYNEIVTATLAELGPIPPRSTRPPRLSLRIAGVVVAIAAGAAALIVAANVGGPQPLATIPTLSPPEEIAPIDEDRQARLLAAPQLEWSTPLGVGATHFVQIGGSTIGYRQTPEGVRAWSTVDGMDWTDHGVVLTGSLPLRHLTEGGPGAVAISENSDQLHTTVGLYVSEDGIRWTERPSTLIDDATGASIVASSADVVVIDSWKDRARQWDAQVVEQLNPDDRAVAEEYGAWTQGDDFLIRGPLFGIAKRISLADLGFDPSDAPPPGFEEGIWYSADFSTWQPVEDPLAETGLIGGALTGTPLPGGEVAIPAREPGSRFVVIDADTTVRSVSSDRLVESPRPWGDEVVGVSRAYPVAQIVQSSDLAEWKTISPDLTDAMEPGPSTIQLTTGPLGLVAAYTHVSWDPSTAYRAEIEADGLILSSDAGSGLRISRGDELVAVFISLQDERLVVHDLAERVITFLHPDTRDPIVTISFEQAAQLVEAQAFGFSESIELLFSPDTIEWSVESPPFYAGGPIRMTDLHVGNGMVIVAAEETAFPFSGTHVLVGRYGQPTSTDPAG